MAKRKIWLGIMAVLFSFVVAQSGFAATGKTLDHKTKRALRGEVKKTMDQLMRAFEIEDTQTVSALFPNDQTQINFGTEKQEVYTGWTALTTTVDEQFNAFDKTKIKVHKQDITLSTGGTVAWVTEIVDATLKAKGEKVSLKNMRITAVLEKQSDGWKVVHLHSSLPVIRQKTK